MKRIAAVLALALTVWAGGMGALALAADDPLSIDANLKYLEDNKVKKGVILRPSGLQFRIIQNGFGNGQTVRFNTLRIHRKSIRIYILSILKLNIGRNCGRS